METIEKFLINAKINSYANSSSKTVLSSRRLSKDYEYKELLDYKQYTYHDTYFGNNNFIGEEVVYKNNKIFWAMNYYGKCINEQESENIYNNVLRPALLKVGQNINVLAIRGPKEYVIKNYKYSFETDGDIYNFTGIEKIYKDNELMYELICHGGLIN